MRVRLHRIFRHDAYPHLSKFHVELGLELSRSLLFDRHWVVIILMARSSWTGLEAYTHCFSQAHLARKHIIRSPYLSSPSYNERCKLMLVFLIYSYTTACKGPTPAF
jgi:hypothetical protein